MQAVLNQYIIHNLPADVSLILQQINEAGYEAVVVGGSIRNLLINYFHKTNYAVKDWDIATNAPYDKLKSIFKGFPTKEVGKSFGVLLVNISGVSYEIAKYRRDGKYSDSRRPDEVFFTNELQEDVSRRDFTINGIAYCLKRGILDYVNGINDIRQRGIRCIGDATERFHEDPLRILRAIRFQAQLKFLLDFGLSRALSIDHNLVNKLAIERIRDEFNKILLSENVYEGLWWLLTHNILGHFLPELSDCFDFDQNNSHHDKSLFQHIVVVTQNTKSDLVTRLAAVFHDIGKVKCKTTDNKGESHYYEHHKVSADMAVEIMTRMKYDNKTIEAVRKLIYEHMQKSQKTSDKAIKRMIKRVGEDNLERLFDLLQADIKGHKPPHNFGALNLLRENTYRILDSDEPCEQSQLAINGHDLISIGFKPGKKLGDALKHCLDYVLEFPEGNEKEKLLDICKDFLN